MTSRLRAQFTLDPEERARFLAEENKRLEAECAAYRAQVHAFERAARNQEREREAADFAARSKAFVQDLIALEEKHQCRIFEGGEYEAEIEDLQSALVRCLQGVREEVSR